MKEVDWYKFRYKNKNYRYAFENLCYHLFCRKYKLNEGVHADFNQVGLETIPIRDKDNTCVGFQAKFFDNKLSDYSSYKQIKDSVEKASKAYKSLGKIIIFTHLQFGKPKPQYKMKIESIAKNKGIKIEWFLKSHFEIVLNSPLYLDLLQFYFGAGDEFGFIKNNCNFNNTTLINSKEFLHLSLVTSNRKKSPSSFLKTKNSNLLLVGNPGSGKSVLMYYFFSISGGLNETYIKKMNDKITKDGALPMLVNLKDCVFDTLENILRNRKNDYKVNPMNANLKFVYLFDGLDELNNQRAQNSLSFIKKLSNNENTQKIIISCREGNENLVYARSYFENIKEYKIDNLNFDNIEIYFKSKGDEKKRKQLELLKQKNSDLISEICDILLIKLLWDTIFEMDADSLTIDLFEKKISFLLKDKDHKKDLSKLNLPEPKSEEIIKLNQKISFQFQKQQQYRMPIKEIQNIILKNYDRINYIDLNLITNYLLEVFFDKQQSHLEFKNTYIYKHRRYQEYFLTLELAEIYEEDRNILRKKKILSNQEYLENIFLKHLRRKYTKENNLPGIVELNLIDLYLGKSKLFSPDDPYYLHSDNLIRSLACQKRSTLDHLLKDQNLKLKEKLNLDNTKIKRELSALSKKNDSIENFLKDISDNKIPMLLKGIRYFWLNNHKDFAKKFYNSFDELRSMLSENKLVKPAKLIIKGDALGDYEFFEIVFNQEKNAKKKKQLQTKKEFISLLFRSKVLLDSKTCYMFDNIGLDLILKELSKIDNISQFYKDVKIRNWITKELVILAKDDSLGFSHFR